jgi:hypothetical protein
MEFAIATLQFWNSVGFDTSYCRKSVDGTLAIIHLQYALILVPDARTNSNITIYETPGSLDEIINSSVWTVSE